MSINILKPSGRQSLCDGLPIFSVPRISDRVSNAMRAHYQRVEVALDGVLESGAPLAELSISHGDDRDPANPLAIGYATTIYRGVTPVARIRLVIE